MSTWYPRGGASGPVTPKKTWDIVRLGGYTMPGHATITAASVELKEDQKGGIDEHGAKPSYHGLVPQPVDIEVKIWTEEQRQLMRTILAAIGPSPKTKPQPLAIQAVQIEDLPIKFVTVRGVGAWLPYSGPDIPRGWKRTLKCRHWLHGTKKSGLFTAERGVRDDRAAKAAAERGTPPPSQQPGVCSPLSTPGTIFTPGPLYSPGA